VAWRLQDPAGTHASFGQCLKLREALARDNLKNVGCQFGLATSTGMYGDARLPLGDAAQARTVYTTSLRFFEERSAKSPENGELRWIVSRSRYRLATALLQLGEAQAARRLYDDALQVREELARAQPDNLPKQTIYMVSLARCGRHEQAVAT